MPLGTSFSLQGATPFNNTPLNFNSNSVKPYSILPTTPQSKALSSATKPFYPTPTGAAPTPKAQTPLKATTTTDAMGNTTKSEYHAPPAPTTTSTPTNNSNVSSQLDSIKQQALGIQSGLLNRQAEENKGSYGGIIQSVVDQSSQPNQNTQSAISGLMSGDYAKRLADAEAAQKRAVGINQALDQGINNQTKGVMPLQFQTGRAAALQRDFGVQAEAATEAAKNAQAIAGLTQTGLTSAGGLSNTAQQISQQGLLGAGSLAAPIQTPYSSQVLDPTTGLPVGGGASGNLQEAVNSVVQKLQSGQMTYADATSALSGYGQGGINALQQALPQGFSVAQSNTLASQQGSIKPAYDYAQAAMKNLQNTIAGLGSFQATNIPILNSITQGASQITGVNSQAVQAFKAAIAEARGAIQKVLAATQGGTPTDYVGQSNALLPDNATPNQIQAAMDTLTSLGESKVGIYGNPGSAGQTNQNQNATTGGWASLGD